MAPIALTQDTEQLVREAYRRCPKKLQDRVGVNQGL